MLRPPDGRRIEPSSSCRHAGRRPPPRARSSPIRSSAFNNRQAHSCGPRNPARRIDHADATGHGGRSRCSSTTARVSQASVRSRQQRDRRQVAGEAVRATRAARHHWVAQWLVSQWNYTVSTALTSFATCNRTLGTAHSSNFRAIRNFRCDHRSHFCTPHPTNSKMKATHLPVRLILHRRSDQHRQDERCGACKVYGDIQCTIIPSCDPFSTL